MAAQPSLRQRHDVVSAQASIEEIARRALSHATPSLGDVLSVWPSDQRGRILLWVLLGPAEEVSVAARFRQHALAGASRELFRGVRRVRDDVPVVLELHDGRTVVSTLRDLSR